MADTVGATDKGVGLSIAFGVVAVIAAVGMLGTSYVYALEGDGQMQIYSGVAFAVAMVAGSLAVAAVHAFDG